jgi:hypothetical protein
MERLIREQTLNGGSLVAFWIALYDGKPFMMKHVVRLPMTAEQTAVAQGTATPEQKKIARKQRRFIVVKEPYYATVEDMKQANNWLSDRGFGKAPLVVQLDDAESSSGFKLIYRRWPIGVDPTAEGPPPGERIIEGKARVLPGPPQTNGHSNGSSNGHS